MSLFLHSSNADESAVRGSRGSTLLEGKKGGEKIERKKEPGLLGGWGVGWARVGWARYGAATSATAQPFFWGGSISVYFIFLINSNTNTNNITNNIGSK